jgi:hypothetical protein
MTTEKKGGAEGMTLVMKYFPINHKTLSSNINTTKINQSVKSPP